METKREAGMLKASGIAHRHDAQGPWLFKDLSISIAPG
jgi:hypothetical protein